jgi:hypothetical protein
MDQKVTARLPSTVIAKIEPNAIYEFTVDVREMRFFDKATELRITARPLQL